MRIHPREKIVTEAEHLLEDTVLKVLRMDLTSAEYVSVLSHVLNTAIQRHTKFAIRLERHGTTDKEGGIE